MTLSNPSELDELMSEAAWEIHKISWSVKMEPLNKLVWNQKLWKYFYTETYKSYGEKGNIEMFTWNKLPDISLATMDSR